MAEIELVIKIDEDEYKARQHWVANPRALINAVDKAVANGTVLPKGHDDLIERGQVTNYDNLSDVPVVIKADKGE